MLHKHSSETWQLPAVFMFVFFYVSFFCRYFCLFFCWFSTIPPKGWSSGQVRRGGGARGKTKKKHSREVAERRNHRKHRVEVTVWRTAGERFCRCCRSDSRIFRTAQYATPGLRWKSTSSTKRTSHDATHHRGLMFFSRALRYLTVCNSSGAALPHHHEPLFRWFYYSPLNQARTTDTVLQSIAARGRLNVHCDRWRLFTDSFYRHTRNSISPVDCNNRSSNIDIIPVSTRDFVFVLFW